MTPGDVPAPDDDPYEGRRQFYELSADELRAQRVWWFPGADGHLTGPDTGTVMPLELEVAEGELGFPEGRYLLAARFTLADGSEMDGHVTFSPGDGGSLAEREPTVCATGAQVTLWHGVLVPAEAQCRRFLATLGRSHSEFFPVRWRTPIQPVGHPLGGTLEGFAVLADGIVAYL